jgi:uncharacterized protein (TIGR01319 family)
MLAMTVDFGSTFTKVLVIDLDQEKVVARSSYPSTVDSDINIGLGKALDKIGSLQSRAELRLACSSAAGGLRIVAIGLVPELTVEAARQAALGAGAKVIGVYSHRLTNEDLQRIEESSPDIVLLSGGTDGGDRETVEHNGRFISMSRLTCPVVVACNREAAPAVEETLNNAGKKSIVTENVMPDLQKLNVEPAKEVIRNLFVTHITKAKGLERAKAFVDLLMPTPSASLNAARLLADGTSGEPGFGDAMVVEVGGATTNVYSVFEEPDRKENVIRKGIQEAKVKRTVEGDLGVRVSAVSLVDSVGVENVKALTRQRPNLDVLATGTRLSENPAFLPRTEEEIEFDNALARLAVRFAVERHVGTLEEIHTPSGRYYFQTGKNYATLSTLVGSGGPIVYSPDALSILDEALASQGRLGMLKPTRPERFVDRDYVLWSMGLLSLHYPDIALRTLKTSLQPVGNGS